jgi:hypothetical protein
MYDGACHCAVDEGRGRVAEGATIAGGAVLAIEVLLILMVIGVGVAGVIQPTWFQGRYYHWARPTPSIAHRRRPPRLLGIRLVCAVSALVGVLGMLDVMSA